MTTPKLVTDIRSSFLDYFGSQGHTIVPSASLVPQNDPTLMFTAAGMVPFKNYFTGVETPPFVRATSSQKCVRAGGKHNDLDNVGYTARHHTFFEMLGNFSFGDYFKEDAIKFAWEMVTKVWGLPPEKLLVTIYHTDDEAAALWQKIAGLPDSKIIRIATSDNFWSAGDTGPCGPCTEIFYDHGPDVWGGPPGSADEDGDRFMEIWNLVFMQYDQLPDGTRINLPKPSIDTGAGLERVSHVLQGKRNNYDIDLIQALVGAAADFTHTQMQDDNLISQRIIADHLRSSAFLVADGVLPTNEGRGYVLRRIMRRAMRHAHLLGAKSPLMHQLVPELITQMGAAYPELSERKALIVDTLEREESKFRETLARGLGLLDAEMAKLPQGGTLAGDVAFKLYDTFGFPLDLTQDVLVRKNMQLDQAGFDAAMNAQKEVARQSWVGSGQNFQDKVWFELDEKNVTTKFVGYDTLQTQSKIVGLLKDGAWVDSVVAGDEAAIVTDTTPFYAEQGGQVADFGGIGNNATMFKVQQVQKPTGKYVAHAGVLESGTLKVGDVVDMQVCTTRRNNIAAHHSATHLLHEALRRHLGDHVAQKGSLVEPDRLRFDISHGDSISKEVLEKIATEVNAQIRSNASVTIAEMPIDDAKKLGARALFGEKYGDTVRVVQMGNDNYSIELCGGTHVQALGQIGTLRLLGESGVSAGVRRIEAVVGEAAEQLALQDAQLLQNLASLTKASVAELPVRLEKLLAEHKSLAKEVADLRRQLAAQGGGQSDKPAIEQINGVNFMAKIFEGLPAQDLKPLADQFKQQMGSGVVVLLTSDDTGKASLVVGVTADLTANISAVDLVRVGASALGGAGGGGRPDLAQAGGPNAADANNAISDIRQKLAA